MVAVQWIEYVGRRVVAYPLAIVGWVLTDFAGLLIRAAAWLIDLPLPGPEIE